MQISFTLQLGTHRFFAKMSVNVCCPFLSNKIIQSNLKLCTAVLQLEEVAAALALFWQITEQI